MLAIILITASIPLLGTHIPSPRVGYESSINSPLERLGPAVSAKEPVTAVCDRNGHENTRLGTSDVVPTIKIVSRHWQGHPCVGRPNIVDDAGVSGRRRHHYIWCPRGKVLSLRLVFQRTLGRYLDLEQPSGGSRSVTHLEGHTPIQRKDVILRSSVELPPIVDLPVAYDEVWPIGSPSLVDRYRSDERTYTGHRSANEKNDVGVHCHVSMA